MQISKVILVSWLLLLKASSVFAEDVLPKLDVPTGPGDFYFLGGGYDPESFMAYESPYTKVSVDGQAQKVTNAYSKLVNNLISEDNSVTRVHRLNIAADTRYLAFSAASGHRVGSLSKRNSVSYSWELYFVKYFGFESLPSPSELVLKTNAVLSLKEFKDRFGTHFISRAHRGHILRLQVKYVGENGVTEKQIEDFIRLAYSSPTAKVGVEYQQNESNSTIANKLTAFVTAEHIGDGPHPDIPGTPFTPQEVVSAINQFIAWANNTNNLSESDAAYLGFNISKHPRLTDPPTLADFQSSSDQLIMLHDLFCKSSAIVQEADNIILNRPTIADDDLGYLQSVAKFHRDYTENVRKTAGELINARRAFASGSNSVISLIAPPANSEISDQDFQILTNYHPALKRINGKLRVAALGATLIKWPLRDTNTLPDFVDIGFDQFTTKGWNPDNSKWCTAQLKVSIDQQQPAVLTAPQIPVSAGSQEQTFYPFLVIRKMPLPPNFEKLVFTLETQPQAYPQVPAVKPEERPTYTRQQLLDALNNNACCFTNAWMNGAGGGYAVFTVREVR